MTNDRMVVERFLIFAEQKGVELGGNVTYGFVMEYTDFRPMHKSDYQNLITDFIASQSTKETK